MTTKPTTNWKPENPCVKCPFAPIDTCPQSSCGAFDEYRSAIAAQKKILEYLIEKANANSFATIIYRSDLESVLKELEEL